MKEMLRLYIGSVRFFKHLILFVIILIISVLAIFVYRFHSRAARYEKMLASMDMPVGKGVTGTRVTKQGLPKEQIKNFSPANPSYQDLYPDFYAAKRPRPVKYKKNTVYLTFDDGPSKCTRDILSVLDAKNVKATFFVTGVSDTESRKTMKAVAEHGHTVGMHTYSHKYTAIYNSVEDYLSDMYNIFKLIKETTGQTPEVFRFPGGSINGHNYMLHSQIMAEMLRRGFIPHDWNVSVGDAVASRITKEKILENIAKYSAGVSRPIVLMHDSSNRQVTANSIGSIIDYYRKNGYNFDRITSDTKPVIFNIKFNRGD